MFLSLALARRQFTGRVFSWDLGRSGLAARLGEKGVVGSRVRGSDVTAFPWLAWAKRHFSQVIQRVLVGAIIYWYVASMWVPPLGINGRRERPICRSLFSVTPGTPR